MTTHVPAELRRGRVGTSAGFFAQGLVLAMLLASLATFEKRYGIGDAFVAGVVLGVCVMAGVGTFVADRLARLAGGSRVALASGLTVVSAAVVLVALAPQKLALLGGFVVYGCGLGMVDATTNMQAVRVQKAYGRSLLTGFYACWSVGGILGAVLVATTRGGAVDRHPDPVLFVGVAVALVAAALVLRYVLRGHDLAVVAHHVAEVVPWRAIVWLGVVVTAYYLTDQAISTWSTIYLDGTLDASDQVAPLGYAFYLGTTLLSRLAGDPLVRRFGRVAVVRVAAIVGLAGLLLVILAPAPWCAILGFAVVGLGLGLVAPLCFSAAGALAPGHEDAVVARLNGFNYVGAVLGGVLGGLVGNATLRIGFVVPAVLVLAVALLASRLGVRHDDAGDRVEETTEARA